VACADGPPRDPMHDSPHDVQAEKAAWRARMLAARRAMPPAGRAAATHALTRLVLTAPAVRRARRVAAYAPMSSEPGSVALLDGLLGLGLWVVLPVVLPGGTLDWAAYDGLLRPAGGEGGRGLCEPAGPRLGPEVLAEVDVVLAPGLAVDRQGTRLGRGGGCYDRALAGLPAPVTVAVLLYDGELVDAVLPAEPHDRPVTAAVAPVLGWVDLG